MLSWDTAQDSMLMDVRGSRLQRRPARGDIAMDAAFLIRRKLDRKS